MENTAASRNERVGESAAQDGRTGARPTAGGPGDRESDFGPAVDVIIPVYNGEAFIGETVASVLRQTHRNVRVLCLIDGSKDRSKAIIESFGDPRIVVLERENRGAVCRRNEGLALSESEFLLFLDHDDVLYPDCLETALAAMRERDAAAVAFGGHLIDAEGRIIRRMYRFFPPRLTLDRLSRGNVLFTTGQVLIRRRALVAVGGFDEGAGSAADWDLWLRLAKRGLEMAFVNRCLMGYRLHDRNDSKNAAKMLAGERYILRNSLRMYGDPDKYESCALMRYAARSGDFGALSEALKLNAGLLFHPRFIQAVLQAAARRRASVRAKRQAAGR